MNRKDIAAAVVLMLPLIASCASYNAYEKARTAERMKDWDQAVTYYQKALDVDPENLRYKIDFQRARLEASRAHFEKAKSLRVAAQTAGNPSDALRLNQLAATEFELTVKLDSTNQYAAVRRSKAVNPIQDAMRAQDKRTIADMKKPAKANNSNTHPPHPTPAS